MIPQACRLAESRSASTDRLRRWVDPDPVFACAGDDQSGWPQPDPGPASIRPA
jgi:hypothetical protein